MITSLCSSRKFLFTTALCGALSAFVPPALADEQYNIPAGVLADVLKAYEAVTGISVQVEGVDISGRLSNGFQGQASARGALDAILAGTQLSSCVEADRVLLISATQSCSVSESAGATATASGSEEVVVTGTRISHLADRNRTGTRMDADPMTLPLSISTVSNELIQRQQAITLADAAANVVGVTSGIEGSFQMRGFTANVMRNGNLGADGRSNDLPIISLSRIEVVKGPEAIIAGLSAGYGGIVNVITKTPTRKRVAELSASVGSRGYYEVGADVGGALDDDGMFLARLVASTQDSDESFAGYDGGSSEYLAPSFTFRQPDWGTELTVQYEYQDLSVAPDNVVFAPPGATSLSDDLPVRRFGAKNSRRLVESRTWTVALEQKISDNWRFSARYSDDQQYRRSTIGSSFLFELFAPYPEVINLGYEGFTVGNSTSTKLELRGAFSTGEIEHKLLLAYDRSSSEISVGNRLVTVSTTNLDTGVITDRTGDLGLLFGAGGPLAGGGVKPEETGYLILDQMTWRDWVVLAGYRYITYEQTSLTGFSAGTLEQGLPSFGVVYRATPSLSFYANASKGFQSNQGLFTIDGNTVEPEYAQQYEIGAKALLFSERVALTVALFSIDQQNVAAPDPDNPYPLSICLGNSQVCYASVPGVKSKGVEIEVSGEVLPGLEIRANYTYTDKEFDPLFQANILYTKHQGTLWLTYSFGDGGMGWWIGGGIQARGKGSDTGRPTDLENPGQVRLDLSAGYDAENWSAVVGVKNATDQRLYDANSGSFGSGTVSQPREWQASIRYRF